MLTTELDHEPGGAISMAAALDALDAARTALLCCQQEFDDRLRLAQAAALEAQQSLQITRSELEHVRQDRNHWHHECLKQQDCCRGLENQIKDHQTRLEGQQKQLENQQADLQDKRADLESQKQRNENLSLQLLDLYKDLRAEDMPALILRIGVKLTGAENGLFIDAENDRMLSDIGMSDLPATVVQALHEFTHQAAQEDAPVVRNDSDALPDGADLVNVAAMPVAMQGTLRGVLLVANKRSGPFTDADTDLLLSIGRHAGVALENQRLHCALSEAYLATIAVLADTVEAKDAYTRGHCEDVARVAVQVAKRLGWKGDDLDRIRYAALLHDIGKIGVPDGILLKPGRLLPEEFQVIQRHALIGSHLVSRVPALAPIAIIILHHHERFDGSGYPDGLSGEDIPLASRIVGAVDAWNAMTTPRPYRNPVSTSEAMDELRRCAGSQFDPAIIDLVVEAISEGDFNSSADPEAAAAETA